VEDQKKEPAYTSLALPLQLHRNPLGHVWLLLLLEIESLVLVLDRRQEQQPSRFRFLELKHKNIVLR
jgi:hypothetical protein